ncbi:hypothetical protein CROQUDRAFT_685048 [Cronartium quercuum f. sp. fusiforme G11]|uniref:Uncharacterized protein n=1 Tax=Cronartium quercuum f. sp. fusiforme G11 TaxID=708437 RepID=A0A9P6T8M0_9BASI|nr:hypothetical protein CROQUDRAFT_685048 [Cronartium quercuum f. sp. fusiforme G11]
MPHNHSKGKAPKGKEIFVEDFDQEVVDYESGVRRQALREEQANIGSDSGQDLIIHLEPIPTSPHQPEASTSPLPESRSKRSVIFPLVDGLKRMMIKKSRSRNDNSTKISIPTPTGSDEEVDSSILQGDLDALAKADHPTLKRALKVLEKQERNRKRVGILATDAVCATLKEEFGDAPSSPLKRQGFLGNEDISEALKTEFGFQPSPPNSSEASENDSGSIYSQSSASSKNPNV